MNLQELFKNDLDEQMPGMMQRLKTGIRAAAGNQRAKGEREILTITKNLASKLDRWAGNVGGLTVEHLKEYTPYKADPLFQDMLKQLEVMYGPNVEIDMDEFEGALLDYVRKRVLKAKPGQAQQATRGIDSKTAELLQNLSDDQLRSWVRRSRDRGMDDSNPVLVAAEAELARRGVGTNLPLNLGPGGGAQAGATPE